MELNEGITSRMTLGGLINNYMKLYDTTTACHVVKSSAASDKADTSKTFTATIRSDTGGIHPVTIKLGKDRSGAYTLASPCKVDCNCATYVYRNNEQLNSVGAALYTRYTKRPSKTGRKANPENIITCCKHLYGYVTFLLKRGDMVK